MFGLMTLAVILFFTVLGPLIGIVYFITKWKQAREISGDDERMLEELWALSQRLEERIETLERILDDDATTHRRQ